MILDVQPPVMRRLYLYGALEVKFQPKLGKLYLFFVISMLLFKIHVVSFRLKILKTESLKQSWCTSRVENLRSELKQHHSFTTLT